MKKGNSVKLPGLGIQLIEAAEADKQGWEWDVEIIQTGLSSNGFYYPPATLEKATPLFEGVRALARADDLHIQDKDKSVKNIVGWFSNPRYEDGKIKARFRISEAAGWLRTLMLDAWQHGEKDIVGFSIVAQGVSKLKRDNKRLIKNVESINRVDTVDVVVSPAAGGRIIRLAAADNTNAGNASEEDLEKMNKLWDLIESKRPDLLKALDVETVTDDQLMTLMAEAMNPSTKQLPAAKPEADVAGQALLVEAQKILDAAKVETEKQTKLAACRRVLTDKLAKAKLPDLTTRRLEKRFSGQAFEEADLVEAIKDEREYLATMTPSGSVSGLGAGKFEVGAGEPDKVLAALDGFFESKDVELDGNKIPRFMGIREAYEMITGDKNVTGHLREAGGLARFNNLREAVVSTTWAEILGDSITRRMQAEYRMPELQSWRKIVSEISAPKDFRTNRRMRLGGYGIPPAVAQGAPYLAADSPGDEESTYSVNKKGHLETVTLETIKNDDQGAVRRIPIKLARGSARGVYQAVLDLIKDNDNVTYEAVNLFDAAHGNLGSAALSATSLLAAKIAMSDQTAYGTTEVLGLVAKWLLVPSELQDTAFRLTKSSQVVGATNNAGTEPNYHSTYGLEVVEVPYWTDVSDWALICNPADCPTIEIGFMDGQESPEIFVQDQPTVGSMFANDKITYKLRHIYGVCVLEHRGMYKAVVA